MNGLYAFDSDFIQRSCAWARAVSQIKKIELQFNALGQTLIDLA